MNATKHILAAALTLACLAPTSPPPPYPQINRNGEAPSVNSDGVGWPHPPKESAEDERTRITRQMKILTRENLFLRNQLADLKAQNDRLNRQLITLQNKATTKPTTQEEQ